MFVAIDGDKIGKRLEQYIVQEELVNLSSLSKDILEYVQAFKELVVKKHHGSVYMAGGDNLFAELTDVDKFLEDFFNYPKGNYHFSVGIGEKAVLAYLALKVAKTSAISGAIIEGYEGKEGIVFKDHDFKKTNRAPRGKLFICNAFSINMLTESNGTGIELKFVPLSLEQAKNAIHEEKKNREIVNAIGHEDTSKRVCQSLGIDYQVNRGNNVSLTPEDVVIVAQYTGERLPIGSTELTEGADINYWKVLRESD